MRVRNSAAVGATIRELRLSRGWNLATLSAKSGVPVSTISRAELGQNALNYDKVSRICEALGFELALVRRGDPAPER